MPETNEAQKKNNVIPSAVNIINLISGLYTPPLWDSLCIYVNSTNSLRKLAAAISALQDAGNAAAAFDLVTTLYEIAGFDVPEAITSLTEYPDGIVLFIGEFIADSNEILYDYELEDTV